jgi:ABC-type uncharacterized transport system permease subunit
LKKFKVFLDTLYLSIALLGMVGLIIGGGMIFFTALANYPIILGSIVLALVSISYWLVKNGDDWED